MNTTTTTPAPLPLPIGTVVRLRAGVSHRCPEGRKNHRTATISATMESFSKGARQVDRDLRGCLFWNVEDLEEVKP